MFLKKDSDYSIFSFFSLKIEMYSTLFFFNFWEYSG